VQHFMHRVHIMEWLDVLNDTLQLHVVLNVRRYDRIIVCNKLDKMKRSQSV
jgi:hypothetical protein